jgi:hypothetical protein
VVVLWVVLAGPVEEVVGELLVERPGADNVAVLDLARRY